MNYILFDGPHRDSLLPLTYTRPVADIRIGILTIREKWERILNTTTTSITEAYLTDAFPMVELEENILIHAAYLPTDLLVAAIKSLQPNQAIFDGENLVAFFTNETQTEIDLSTFDVVDVKEQFLKIENTWDIFLKNGEAIEADFKLLIAGKKTQPIPDNVNVIHPERIFIEEGATLNFATLNATNGSIYIGKNADIMEGSIVRGPFALCDNATLKLGAKIYGSTTVGPYSKVGGEVNNAVIFGYSNKGHDGFLGNSVLGEWCNLGAGTSTSNLKNNYAEVRLWSYNTEGFAKTGLQFCGLIMGDHSKCGINTMFNTGTVVGVSANIFGSGFPRNFVPSFSWGGSKGFTTYLTKKAFEVSQVVMARRDVKFTETDAQILNHIFEVSAKYRKL